MQITGKLASEESYRSYRSRMIIISIVILIIAIFLYYTISRKFLKNQGNTFKNILSVSLVSVIGIYLLLFAYIFSGLELSNKSTLWKYYNFYYGYILSLLINFKIQTFAVLITISLMPSVVMGISITKD